MWWSQTFCFSRVVKREDFEAKYLVRILMVSPNNLSKDKNSAFCD